MRPIHLFLVSVMTCASALAGCGDDTSGTGGTGGTAGGGGTGGENAFPPPPALGAQIDRFGRPAINTALNNTFNADLVTKDAAKDNYNHAKRADWSGFAGEFALNLGILDSLDANCGNQFLADPVLGPDRYAGLAGVLADDRLWVNLASDSCTTYLAVEANATMALPNNDCGGRRPADDVIERSYSLLAAGLLTGVDDTILADPIKTGVETFPYLAPATP
jgi:hypothetical protein